MSVDELEEDNNTDVYFDKRFDKTDYGLLEVWTGEKDVGDNFTIFLADKIRSENGYDSRPSRKRSPRDNERAC